MEALGAIGDVVGNPRKSIQKLSAINKADNLTAGMVKKVETSPGKIPEPPRSSVTSVDASLSKEGARIETTGEAVATKGAAAVTGVEPAAVQQARAAELNAMRPSWEAERGTTAAVQVENLASGERQTWLATEGAGNMPREWSGALKEGERFVKGPGHAEETIVNALGSEWRIIEGGTSRNVCKGTCAPLLESRGARLFGPAFPGRDDKTPHRMFRRDE
jgi:hypothetical protein